MKRISILFVTAIIFLSLMFSSCTAPIADQDLTPQIPDESEVYFESIFDVKIEDVQEAQEEEKEETQDIQIENDNIENIQEEAQELITEPLKFLINKDLTEDDIEYLMPYIEIELFIEDTIDISLLSNLENLEKLEIYQGIYPNPLSRSNNFISDFSFLNGMDLKSLKLDCGDNNIILNTLNLENLEVLELYYVNIVDDVKIKSLPNLKNLAVWHSQIKLIDAFTRLKIVSLDLYWCDFEQQNIDKINEIITLEKLLLRTPYNINFTTLSGLINLNNLSINGVNIHFNIETIYKLIWLKSLYIDPNLITEEQLENYKKINPDCLVEYSITGLT